MVLSLLPIGYCLWRIQDAANGLRPTPWRIQRLYLGNWLWIVLGILLWGLVC